MSTTEKLRKQRQTPTSIFLRFTRIYKQYKQLYKGQEIYCFFEGSDDPKYYQFRIKTIARCEEIITINCDGKNNVIKVYQLIYSKPQYKTAKIAYFIDRDFDCSIYENDPNLRTRIYETPCYSIENFYTSLQVLKEIIKTEFKTPEYQDSELDDDLLENPDFKNCLNLYQQRQKEFHDHVTLLNCWLACQRQKQTRLNLKNKSVNKFIKITLEKITCNYSLENLLEQFPDAETIPESELLEQINRFNQQDKQKIFRGKFELDFSFEFIHKLIEDINQKQPKYFSQKIKVSSNTTRLTIISNFCQYADTPDCLDEYLRRYQ